MSITNCSYNVWYFPPAEHFLDTEYDKAKTGHDKTSGVKEHEKHNDHDSHENKKTHEKEHSGGHRLHSGGSLGKTGGSAADEGAESKDKQLIWLKDCINVTDFDRWLKNINIISKLC